MALWKVLYVTAGPAATPDLDNIIALSFTVPRGSFLGTGDNALAVHAGRTGIVTGTATVEDMTSAETAVAAALAATAAFTCVSFNTDTVGTCTVTFSDFALTGLSENLGDGLAVGAPIPGIALTFEAKSVATAPVV